MQVERHLVEQHIAALRRYAWVLTGSPSETDDLVQECLARALARVKVWQEVRDVRAFLFTVMHNLHIDQLRRAAHDRGEVSLDAVAEHQASCEAVQPIVLELEAVGRALGKLPARQRQTLLLASLDGLSYREISERMRVPVGTVMSRLARGREALRRHMKGTGLGATGGRGQRRAMV